MFQKISSLKVDIFVVVAFRILPKKYIELPKFGSINIHASLLPKYRGAAPIQRAIMNMEKETGVSIMKIVEKLDAGPVMLKSKIKLTKESNYTKVSQQMTDIGAKLILEALDKIESGEANFVNQNEDEATYAKKIDKFETQVDWGLSASIIEKKVRAFYPSPAMWFKYKGQRFKILKAKIGNGIGKSGEVISDNLEIACAKNKSIKILEIQREGKKIQKVEEFMLGSIIKKGSIILNV